jgi:hypothetical protein
MKTEMTTHQAIMLYCMIEAVTNEFDRENIDRIKQGFSSPICPSILPDRKQENGVSAHAL